MLLTHLLLLPQGKKTDTRYFYNLEADTRNITLGLTATTETRDQNFVVLIDKVQATVILYYFYSAKTEIYVYSSAIDIHLI